MREKLILVVDDEISIVEIWQEVFNEMGHKVMIAHNGNSAVSMIKKYDFDLVLTDMKMPGSDGIVILKHVSNIDLKPMIVVSSGYVEYQDITEKFNIEKIMPKPFVLEEEIKYFEEVFD